MGRRVLVVDDDEGVRLTIRHILQVSQCDVRLACDSPEACRVSAEFRPDLVITDLVMPHHEGTAIISQLKAAMPGVKIIAMSGGARLGDANILRSAQAAGADGVLAKPFTLGELVALAEALLAADRDAGRPLHKRA